jgi:hypothetical protein
MGAQLRIIIISSIILLHDHHPGAEHALSLLSFIIIIVITAWYGRGHVQTR